MITPKTNPELFGNYANSDKIGAAWGQIPSNPITPAPATPVATPVANPTISDIYKNANIGYETPSERSFMEGYGQNLLTESQAQPDLATIRKQTMDRFQAEIDALNTSYAQRKAQEALAGQGRLGQTSAIQARRGLLGSDFGSAMTGNVEKANQEIQNAIEAERLAAVQSILRQSEGFAQQEYDKRVQAKREGAENYIKFIQDSANRRKENVSKMAQYLYSTGQYDQLGTGELGQIANNLGVSTDTLKSVYNDYATQAKASEQQALSEQKKAQAELEAKQASTAQTVKETEMMGVKEDDAMLKDLALKGYNYVSTPAQRDQLIKQGYTMVQIKGKTYAKAPEIVTIGKRKAIVNAQGDVIKYVGDTSTPSVPKQASTEKTALNEMTSAIGSVTGSDGYVSPDDYATLRKQWVDAGLNATTFDTKFKGYRNPKNTGYVTNK